MGACGARSGSSRGRRLFTVYFNFIPLFSGERPAAGGVHAQLQARRHFRSVPSSAPDRHLTGSPRASRACPAARGQYADACLLRVFSQDCGPRELRRSVVRSPSRKGAAPLDYFLPFTLIVRAARLMEAGIALGNGLGKCKRVSSREARSTLPRLRPSTPFYSQGSQIARPCYSACVCRACFSFSSSTSSRRSTLPAWDLGSSARNSTEAGTL